MDCGVGNDHQQDALGLQPRIGMAEKQLFHALVGAGSHFEVIGRVQIKEGETFHPGAHVEYVGLDGLDAICLRTLGAVGVELHSIES